MRKVSVIIPCFNAGRHLQEAVESALAQTYADLEVVVVDDGSSDRATTELLAGAAWPRTRVFHQANAGPSAARNYAIREAHGDYILPLDADDTIEPAYVEKAAAVLDARPKVGCVYCKAMKFGVENGSWDLPAYSMEQLVVDNVIFVTALFRRADWSTIGGFDEHLRHGVEDYDFWIRMVASGKDVVQLDEYLFNYRVQDRSRTTRFQGGLEGKISTYAEIFRANRDFYATHAEAIFRHRFGLYAELVALRDRCRRAETDKRDLEIAWRDRFGALEAKSAADLAYWKERYGELDAFLERHASLRKGSGRLKSMLTRRRAVPVAASGKGDATNRVDGRNGSG